MNYCKFAISNVKTWLAVKCSLSNAGDLIIYTSILYIAYIPIYILYYFLFISACRYINELVVEVRITFTISPITATKICDGGYTPWSAGKTHTCYTWWICLVVISKRKNTTATIVCFNSAGFLWKKRDMSHEFFIITVLSTTEEQQSGLEITEIKNQKQQQQY